MKKDGLDVNLFTDNQFHNVHFNIRFVKDVLGHTFFHITVIDKVICGKKEYTQVSLAETCFWFFQKRACICCLFGLCLNWDSWSFGRYDP